MAVDTVIFFVLYFLPCMLLKFYSVKYFEN